MDATGRASCTIGFGRIMRKNALQMSLVTEANHPNENKWLDAQSILRHTTNEQQCKWNFQIDAILYVRRWAFFFVSVDALANSNGFFCKRNRRLMHFEWIFLIFHSFRCQTSVMETVTEMKFIWLYVVWWLGESRRFLVTFWFSQSRHAISCSCNSATMNVAYGFESPFRISRWWIFKNSIKTQTFPGSQHRFEFIDVNNRYSNTLQTQYRDGNRADMHISTINTTDIHIIFSFQFS